MKSDSDLPLIPALVDLDRLEEMSEGGTEGIRELAEMYLHSMDENVAKLQEAIREQRYEEIERIAHSAVGASSLIGMLAIVPVLRRLEDIGERKTMTGIPEGMLELQSVYARIQQFLESRGILKKDF